MPPALSDEEMSSDEEEIPLRRKAPAHARSESEPEPEPVTKSVPVDSDEDSEGEEDEEEYIVEKILTHRFRAEALEYQVKWQGYDKKSDLTWEPEDNLDGAQEIVEEYHSRIGGRPEPGATKGKKRGRKSVAADESASSTPVVSTKRAKQKKEWSPPPGSWENDVDYVDTVEQSTVIDKETGEPKRFAFLTWKNSKKTQHPLKHVYQKCPQKMLQYYESHLVFTQSEPEPFSNGKHIGMNGDDMDNIKTKREKRNRSQS